MSLDSAPPPCHTRRRAADLGPLSFGCGLDLASSHLCSINFAGCGAATPAGYETGRRGQDQGARRRPQADCARADARDGVRRGAGRGDRERNLPAARVRRGQERHSAEARRHQGRSGPRCHQTPKRAPVPLCACPPAILRRFRPATRSFAWRSLRATLLCHRFAWCA
jgi:hypothetical protein